MTFAVGSLVKARGREWVVLPETSDDLVLVRPLGGTEDEATGILTSVEEVRAASFPPPTPAQVGDDRSARLLRDALRLGFRSSAGPFRSFGRISVEPRPYQLVPLLMALRLDPVRLLIADDVGIGKTVEASLIARELLDQGEVGRLAVLCPPHLAEQWEAELREKFHIDAQLVLPSTAGRLERDLRIGETVFERHPFTIVSLDYIKSDKRRSEFVRTCPELVIVDEAHTCAAGATARGAQHLRHLLVQQVAADPGRHLLLVTATPHSGKGEAFRSLLSLVDPQFAELPEELTGPNHAQDRRRLARHLVQRRRGDIRQFQTDTAFPERVDAEETYTLTAAYRRLFEGVLTYAREQVADRTGSHHQQRVRWWSALALLRCVASSPAAAAATLRSRADTADTETADEADQVGIKAVLDETGSGDEESVDTTPGTDPGTQGEASPVRRRLQEMALEADRLRGKEDAKLQKGVRLVERLVAERSNPIVFCRFIPTATYVAEELRRRLPREIAVEAVTGRLPAAAREERVEQLMGSPRRILVATDCLSEGINLQAGFDAVLHYDLSWNPTRHEQREGRVDRFGQASRQVRVVTYYGTDNQIDGIVLEVLIRKHKSIRRATGVAVPVPGDPNLVVETIVEGLILRRDRGEDAEQLLLLEEELAPKEQQLLLEWDDAAEREKRSRTVFAQEAIKVDEVAHELEEIRRAIGDGTDVRHFVTATVEACGGTVSGRGVTRLHLTSTPVAMREALRAASDGADADELRVTFEPASDSKAVHLGRTHPAVEGLASWALSSALDPQTPSPASRCGAIRTKDVDRRTTLLLVRYRFHLVVERDGATTALLAEDAALLAFAGAAASPSWLREEDAERLLALRPSQNLSTEQKVHFVGRVVDSLPVLTMELARDGRRRADLLLESHRRVRRAAGARGIKYRVEPHLPPDVLGVYVFLPEVRA